MDQLGENCSALGLSDNSTKDFLDCWSNNGTIRVTSLVSRTVAANQLIDMDWTFGVTAASDDMDQVGKTFLHLKLTLDDGEAGPKSVFMELSLEQVRSKSTCQ